MLSWSTLYMYSPGTPILLDVSMSLIAEVKELGSMKELFPELNPMLAPPLHWMSPYENNTNDRSPSVTRTT